MCAKKLQECSLTQVCPPPATIVLIKIQGYFLRGFPEQFAYKKEVVGGGSGTPKVDKISGQENQSGKGHELKEIPVFCFSNRHDFSTF
jgi:hypothetical protein